MIRSDDDKPPLGVAKGLLLAFGLSLLFLAISVWGIVRWLTVYKL